MNVVLVGEESAGLQVLRALGRSCHKLVAVLAAPPNSEAAGSNVWNVAQKMGFDTWPANLVKEATLANRLRAKQVDILLNVHSLYIIHKEVLAAPRFGCFNLHPAPLPRYAGLNAISWSIYRGEKTHGVTIHKMDPAIDAGPIAYQSIFPIEDDDGALSLSFKCIQQGVGLMLKLLDVAGTDPQKIPLVPQDISKREYFGAGIPDSGQLHWTLPAERIVNFVRACDYFPFHSPWGHPRTQLRDHKLAIVKASRTGIPTVSPPGTIGSSTDRGVLISAMDEWVLVKKVKVGAEYQDALNILTPGDCLDCPH